MQFIKTVSASKDLPFTVLKIKEIYSVSTCPGREELMVISDGVDRGLQGEEWLLWGTHLAQHNYPQHQLQTEQSRDHLQQQGKSSPASTLLHLCRDLALRSVGEAATAKPTANLAYQGLSLPSLPSSWDALVLGASPRHQPHTPWSQQRMWKSTQRNTGSPKLRAADVPPACNSKRLWRNLLICC